MKVAFFLNFKDKTKCRETIVEQSETLLDLLLTLSERFGEGFRKSVFENNQLSSDVLILINGHSAHNLYGLATRLAEEDKVDIFPALSGG